MARLPAELSSRAKARLSWLTWYERHGRNARRTCERFAISPDTFYRWLRRYRERGVRGLEERSRRPHRVRQPTWSPDLVQGVQELRETYPGWGKMKLAVLLQRVGHRVSASTVGRILRHLKRRGLLREPLRFVSARKGRRQRPYAIRKPKDYRARQPGDLVEVDTLDLRPLPGVVLKQFTARDVVSRWDVLEVHTRATATLAAGFLETLLARMPFPVRAIQVDGGSEFAAAFEQACQERGIPLFELPPHSPKLNGHVERAHRTHVEEFYEAVDSDFTLTDLRPKLLAWEHTYNKVRPHQALDYRTPQEGLARPFPRPSERENGPKGFSPLGPSPPGAPLGYHNPKERR